MLSADYADYADFFEQSSKPTSVKVNLRNLRTIVLT
jgi:hypothetical protein